LLLEPLFQLLLELLFLPPELLFQLHQFLSEPVFLQFAAVTKDKILSIDLEASSFDGITNSTTRIRVSINHCKTGMFNFELLLLRCVQP
jgi:hypothetical protein